MVSFAFFDEAKQQYVLGPPIATVPENTNYVQSWNPTFELSYWRTGLRWAQAWRERLGLPRKQKWDDVIQKLAPLPEQDGVYLSQENMPDTYTKMNWEHPSLIGPGGPFPYFPTNGGILYAVALMAAGWDGAPDYPAPGFPNDGSWVVRFERLAPAP
ncbi:hypothetical protein AGMMS50239_33240 [Bacteroidia bacterium]|nr:hypothetical protein AGMMS50239_33240 [Bacteroidia bacterium]